MDDNLKKNLELYYYSKEQLFNFGDFEQEFGIKNISNNNIKFVIELLNVDINKDIIIHYDNYDYTYKIFPNEIKIIKYKYKIYNDILNKLKNLNIEKNNLLNHIINLNYKISIIENTKSLIKKQEEIISYFPFLYDRAIYLYNDKISDI